MGASLTYYREGEVAALGIRIDWRGRPVLQVACARESLHGPSGWKPDGRGDFRDAARADVPGIARLLGKLQA